MRKSFSNKRWALAVCAGVIIFFSMSVHAAQRQWSGGGDAASWEDAPNWSPRGVPSESDDIVIDTLNSLVTASETFNAGTLTVGGREESNFTTQDFVYGILSPSEGTDTALHIKKSGLVTLTGAGDITLKGAFKNSEESLPAEPSFIFIAE